MERRPLVILGSGPAGSASALFLQKHDPHLAAEALVLDRAVHPRPKVCAGGLIPHTLDCLQELDLPLSVPNAVVHRARVDVPGRTVDHEDREMCRVIRRDEFDHLLARTVRDRGTELREGETVLDLRRENGGVRIETDRTTYHARLVIGADGSGSRVRRALVPGGRQCVGKAVLMDIPVSEIDWDGWAAERYDFRFNAVPDGLPGYFWAFPCEIDGVPHVNIGVYSVEAENHGRLLNRVLEEECRRLGARPRPRKSFPIRWYGKGVKIAAPHVLLAGDAAGVDALMGEGISYCFEYGRRAASAAASALARGNYDGEPYEASVRDSWFGKKLRRLELGARLFYGPASPLFFGIASRSQRAREIGLRWYNGVDGWDRRRGWHALAAMATGRLDIGRPTGNALHREP